METILEHAQGLVYVLLHLMPSSYQHASISSLLGLFLEAQGHPAIAELLPQVLWMKRLHQIQKHRKLADDLGFEILVKPLPLAC